MRKASPPENRLTHSVTTLEVLGSTAAQAQPAAVNDGLRSAIRYDLLRTVLWSLTRSGEAAHVVRVLNLAFNSEPCPTAGSIMTASARRDRLRRCLDELEEAGDAEALDDGRWIPAPVRVVPLPGSHSEKLLVGGVPSALLGKDLGDSIVAHGAFRRTSGEAIQRALGLSAESLESWSGIPDGTIREWGKAILGGRLSPYQEDAGKDSVFMLYAPQKARRYAIQTKRWERPWKEAQGRFLAQRSRIFGVVEYRLVEVNRGKVSHSSACLAPGEARRLRYAVDAIEENPTRVHWESQPPQERLEFWSELPKAEQRLFTSLGRLTVDEDRYYPRVWDFESRHWDLVRRRLEQLEVFVSPRHRTRT